MGVSYYVICRYQKSQCLDGKHELQSVAYQIQADNSCPQKTNPSERPNIWLIQDPMFTHSHESYQEASIKSTIFKSICLCYSVHIDMILVYHQVLL